MALENLGGGSDALQIIEPVLTELAVQYRPHGFAYDQLVTNFPVRFDMGQYPIFDLAGFYASGDSRPIADDAETPIINFKYELGKYHAQNYRKRVRVTRQDENQAHPALRLVESKITGLLDVFAGEREKRLAELLRVTANGGQLTTTVVKPSVKWDKGTSGSPATIQEDVKTAVQEVYKKTGKRPNTIVMTALVAEAIALDFTLKDQLKYTMGMAQISEGPGILPDRLFGLKTIIVDGVQTNTAQGGATASLEEIWSDSVRVLYVDPNAAWGTPSIAYGFRAPVLGGFEQSTAVTAPGPSVTEPDAGAQYIVVDRWAEPDPPANNYRVWEKVDERIVAPQLGAEIEDVLS